MNSGRLTPGRRGFLGLAAAGAVFSLAGCSGCPAPRAPRPGQTTAAAALTAVADVPTGPGGGPYTVQDLLSTPSFYIAHRGSGDNWPEHTMLAYRSSVAAGLKALEVSVWSTADGVFVCHHDANTQRMTGLDLTISRASYAALASAPNNARAWLGPASPLEPIPRLDGVLKEFAATHVIFLEDKDGSNTELLLNMLEGIPGAREHIVWKQPITSPEHAVAHRHGYTTWGYFGNADLEKAPAYVDAVDLLGAPVGAPDDTIKRFVDTGKPVIGWEVHRRSERDRLQRLGVRGMMCSNIRYVLQREPVAGRDSFGSGIRAAGDLPWDAASDWLEQPDFLAGPDFPDGGVRLGVPTAAAYTLGSMGPVTMGGWRLDADLRWSDGLPASDKAAGLAFAQDDDAGWRPGQRPFRTGYSAELTAGGRLVLYRMSPGDPELVTLASEDGPPAKPRTWESLSVAVTTRGVAVSRAIPGGSPRTVASADTDFRGGYFSLIKDDDGGRPVEFRHIRVSALDPGLPVCPA